MKKFKSELIDFSHVSARRGHRVILRDLNLKIRSSESLAILGPNGSGKSTLIKLLTRELYSSEGSLRLLGAEDWDVFELRSHLGIISNDLQAQFVRDMTGFDAVISGFFSSVGIWQNNRLTSPQKKKTRDVLKRLEISHLAERKMDEISSGESRRLLIARALVHDPQTLIFDEPTNSLDLKAQHELRIALRRLVQSGIGIVLATHHLSDILPEMERVIGLKEGRIIVDGRKENVLTEPVLKKIFDASLTVVKQEGLYHAY